MTRESYMFSPEMLALYEELGKSTASLTKGSLVKLLFEEKEKGRLPSSMADELQSSVLWKSMAPKGAKDD